MFRVWLTIVAALSLGVLAPDPSMAKDQTPSALPGAGDTMTVQIGPPQSGTSAYVALPAGKGPAPAIVIVPEWWGLNAQIKKVAMRLAIEGYVAIVPDLYRGKVANDAEEAHVLARGLDERQVLADLDAAIAWLRSREQVGRSRIGVMGFCMGGAFALQSALHSPAASAVVVFYGTPETDPGKLASLRAPLMGHFGEADDGIPVARVRAFQDALKKLGKTAEIYTYAGAGHAFMNETRPSFRPDAARQAWARTLAFLQRQLRG